jgi:hypothetical protein
MFFFRLFSLCSARVSALVIMLSGSPCERIEKLETRPILKENRSLVRVEKNCHIIKCIESDSF